jgi:DNA polymerase-1
VARRWIGVDLPKDEQKGDWTVGLRPEQVAYAARDAWVLVPLADALWHGAGGRKGIEAEELVRVAALEDACVPAVADMEYDGIGVDLAYWEGLAADLRAEAAAARAETLRLLEPAAGRGKVREISLINGVEPALNLDSPEQVLGALKALGLTVESTAEEALKPLVGDHAGVSALLRYKKAAKLVNAFGEALPRHIHPKTQRIHAHYQQLCANGVGRFSCSTPNVQQIPHDTRFRKAFVAREGYRLVIADLSQIELRIMAKLSGDRRMLEAYRNGEDLHRLTASLVSGVPLEQVTKAQRQMAKAVNFGLIYGMSANGLRAYAQNAYGVSMTQEEAETFRRRFFEAYRGVAAFHHRQDRDARRARETRTLLGRCRRWPDANMGLPELANTPDQGSGADVLKSAMASVRTDIIRVGAALVASVHDELVVECPADKADEVEEKVRSALVEAGAALLDPVPVEAEATVGETWADKA